MFNYIGTLRRFRRDHPRNPSICNTQSRGVLPRNLFAAIEFFLKKIMAVKAPSQRRSASHCIIEHYVGVAGAVINGGRNIAPDGLGKNIAYPCIASEPLAELHY